MQLLLVIESRDTKYVNALSSLFARFTKTKAIIATQYKTYTHLKLEAAKHGCSHIATTSLRILKLFDPFLEGTEAENQGYRVEKDGLHCVLLPPLSHIWATNSGRFLIDHYLRKLAKPQEFLRVPPLVWFPVTVHENWQEAQEFLRDCELIAIDIETEQSQLCITSVSYTGLRRRDGECRSYVIDLRSVHGDELNFMFTVIRKLNSLPAPKIMQRGIYDCMYFCRFNSPVTNYIFDTYNFQHCMFPELKKELEFLAIMYTQNSRFWKEENTSDLLEYNAKDTHYTLWTWLGMMQYCKANRCQYALKNYLIEFKLVFPSLLCALEGFAIDHEEQGRLRTKEVAREAKHHKSLEILTGLEGINPGSPKQMVQLMKAVGYRQAKSSDDKSLKAFAEDHPLYERLAGTITECRKARKAISNYYDFQQLHGRLLYELDPAGTETGRLASKKSAFWCGSQIQNQPAYCKSQYIPDSGYLLGCSDGSQAESRCTAYISEDRNLITAVETSPDFHCENASRFFGIPFEQLYDAVNCVVLNKPIRILSKRVNHGANYNMGAYVLAETMGTENVFRAAHLLGLPSAWGKIKICEYLLSCFDKAYPVVRGDYYTNVVKEIEMTGKLVGATGWTRRTFLRPRKDKHDLNSAVAHPPQSLSVMKVNRAFFAAFKRQLETKSQQFRLKAQVHDEIVFQYKPEYGEVTAVFIKTAMEEPTKVNGRILVIPSEPKLGGKSWAELKD